MSLSINIHNHYHNSGDFKTNSQPSFASTKGCDKSAQSLDDLLIKTGKGGALLNPDKKEQLERVATFMDKHPEIFGKPHGRETWLSELKEDGFLSGPEANKFAGAIDMIKDASGNQGASASQGAPQGEYATNSQDEPKAGKQNFDNALIPSGNGESYMNPSKKNELESLAKFMDQHPEIFGKPDGAETWLSELKENNHLDKKETEGFTKAMDLMKDAQGAMGSPSETSAPSQNYGTPAASGAESQDSTGGKGMDLKNALVETGKGDAYLNPSKKEELESIAKYMDQHPEVFGKPDGKDSWLSELKEDNYLDKNEVKGFKQAIDMMQDAQSAVGGNGAPQSSNTQPAYSNTSPTAEATETKPQGKPLNLSDVLVPTGKGDSYFNPSKKEEMEAIAKYMDQHPEVFGKPDGKDSWLSELKEDNYLSKDETKSFQKGMEMMQDAQGATGTPTGQSTPPTSTTPPASESQAPQSTEGKPQGKTQNLDDILVQTGKGDAYFNPSKKAEMESVAKFMDQHPETFGKPDGKETWLSELKEDNYLSSKENKAFSSAIDMMKDARGAQ